MTSAEAGAEEGGRSSRQEQVDLNVFLLLKSAPAAAIARVAQLTERWSYKPEVEGLSPSLGTNKQGMKAEG